MSSGMLRALVALTLGLFVFQANAMAGFGKNCMFSEVTGRVLQHGQPVEGAVIGQQYKWLDKDKSYYREIKTDADGRFSFDPLYDGSALLRFIPANPSIKQNIYIEFEGQQYIGWDYLKANFLENSEVGGRKLNLVCELSETDMGIDDYRGICRIVESED